MIDLLPYCTIHFHSLPSNADQRAKWIEAIENHQKVDRQKFNVCIRHFEEAHLKQNGSKKTLIPGAIPSIFTPKTTHAPDEEIQAEVADINVEMEVNNSDKITQSILRSEIANLKREILIINTTNDLKVQKLEKKIISLENTKQELYDKLKKCREECSKEKATNTKLNEQISVLKNKQFISENDTKFSNVTNANFYKKNSNKNMSKRSQQQLEINFSYFAHFFHANIA